VTAGYSGTPLWKKLGLKSDMPACVLNAPQNYTALLGSDAPLADWRNEIHDGIFFIHAFTKIRFELEEILAKSLSNMARDGMVWISWPKKASKVPTEITEDVIREIALPTGLVDVKVCAVDATWSGLKLVIRKELR
jgi:hypothetical protein